MTKSILDDITGYQFSLSADGNTLSAKRYDSSKLELPIYRIEGIAFNLFRVNTTRMTITAGDI